MPSDPNYATLIDDPIPLGAAVHTLPNATHWEPDDSYRTIRVERTDGSHWYCRAILPSRLIAQDKDSDTVSPMPDGKTFCTGYYVVDRNDPGRFAWITAPLRIEWSTERDVVFFFAGNMVIAYGRSGFAWKLFIDAEPDTNLLFDVVSAGELRVTAQRRERNADGDPAFMGYAIDVASGSILSKWPCD